MLSGNRTNSNKVFRRNLLFKKRKKNGTVSRRMNDVESKQKDSRQPERKEKHQIEVSTSLIYPSTSYCVPLLY